MRFVVFNDKKSKVEEFLQTLGEDTIQLDRHFFLQLTQIVLQTQVHNLLPLLKS